MALIMINGDRALLDPRYQTELFKAIMGETSRALKDNSVRDVSDRQGWTQSPGGYVPGTWFPGGALRSDSKHAFSCRRYGDNQIAVAPGTFMIEGYTIINQRETILTIPPTDGTVRICLTVDTTVNNTSTGVPGSRTYVVGQKQCYLSAWNETTDPHARDATPPVYSYPASDTIATTGRRSMYIGYTKVVGGKIALPTTTTNPVSGYLASTETGQPWRGGTMAGRYPQARPAKYAVPATAPTAGVRFPLSLSNTSTEVYMPGGQQRNERLILGGSGNNQIQIRKPGYYRFSVITQAQYINTGNPEIWARLKMTSRGTGRPVVALPVYEHVHHYTCPDVGTNQQGLGWIVKACASGDVFELEYYSTKVLLLKGHESTTSTPSSIGGPLMSVEYIGPLPQSITSSTKATDWY